MAYDTAQKTPPRMANAYIKLHTMLLLLYYNYCHKLKKIQLRWEKNLGGK